MNNYIIYKDDNKQIEIDGFYHELIQLMCAPYIVVPTFLHHILLNIIADELMEVGIGNLEDILICSNKILKNSYKNPANLEEDFEVFYNYIRQICSIKDFKENYKEFQQDFNEKEKLNQTFMGSFEETCLGLMFYLAKKEDDQIKIMIFIYK